MENQKNRTERFVLIMIACIWLFICLFPIWDLLSVTFSTNESNIVKTYWPNSLSAGIENLYGALKNANVLFATGDTLAYTTLCVIGMLFTCSLASYEFSFYNFPMKKLLFAVIMSSMMLPMILYVIPLYRFVYNIGLADTILGVALPLMVSPLSVFIMNQFLEDVPISFIESARIDGAGHFQIYFSIVLPLMRNGFITASVLLFLRAWGNYLWPSLVTAKEIAPMSVAIANLLHPNFYVAPRIKIAAMLLAMVPPLLIYFVFQRYVIKGISMSGVKG